MALVLLLEVALKTGSNTPTEACSAVWRRLNTITHRLIEVDQTLKNLDVLIH